MFLYLQEAIDRAQVIADDGFANRDYPATVGFTLKGCRVYWHAKPPGLPKPTGFVHSLDVPRRWK